MTIKSILTQLIIIVALLSCCSCQHSQTADIEEPAEAEAATDADPDALELRTYKLNAFTDFQCHQVVDGIKETVVPIEWNEDDHLIGLSGKLLTVTTTIKNHDKIKAHIDEAKAKL